MLPLFALVAVAGVVAFGLAALVLTRLDSGSELAEEPGGFTAAGQLLTTTTAPPVTPASELTDPLSPTTALETLEITPTSAADDETGGSVDVSAAADSDSTVTTGPTSTLDSTTAEPASSSTTTSPSSVTSTSASTATSADVPVGSTSTTTPQTTTTEAATTEPSPGSTPSGNNIVLSVDFETSAIGPYGRDEIEADWPGLRYAKTGDRANIVNEGGNRFVRIAFPEGAVGTDDGGSLWQVELGDDAADELYVAYRVRFVGSSFDFVKGGKLPGLSGGEDNTGGEVPNGTDGWSGRVMWRPGGQAAQYLYHPDQPGTFGEDLSWGVAFAPNRWTTVETRIKMNTPGRNDGVVESWIDGTRVLSRTDIRFRDTDAFNIDSLLFHTFFGGSGADWAPTKDELVDFDNVVVSRSPITH